MSQHKIVIEPNSKNKNFWKDLRNYRGLFYFLAWRDILVRYKQTAIGIAWSVLRPLITIVVFTVIFGKLAKFPSQGVPYALLICSAILPWQFFSNAFGDAANSLVNNSNLLTKIYFPRIIVPASAVMVSLVDFLISFCILIIMMVWYHFLPSWHILLLPLFLILALITALGSGFLIATLNVKYRDFRFIIPFIIQFGLFISPVGFSSNVVPEKWKLLYSLNPMVGVIDGFRWSILGGESTLYLPGFILSFILSMVLLFAGIYYFRKMEKTFADVI